MRLMAARGARMWWSLSSTQHSAPLLSTHHSALSTQHPAPLLSTHHSALSHQHPALPHHHSALSPQHTAPPLSHLPHQSTVSRCLHTGQEGSDPIHTAASTTTTTTTTTPTTPTSVQEVVHRWCQSLTAEQVPEAELAAQHIVAHVLGLARSELESRATTTLSPEQLDEVERLATCRLCRMPLQYILGEWDFHSITVKVVPPVFIPRVETEHLVDLAITTLKEMTSPRVLEMCCGSGAVSLALLHSLPQVECVAVDQSRHAVQLTRTNAEQLGLGARLKVVMGKITKEEMPSLPHSCYDLVVANPPYVLRKDLMGLQPEIVVYEDLRALDGGKDGMDVIKAVVLHASRLLVPGGKLLMEVDVCHPYLLPAWLEKQNLSLKLLKVHQDYSEKDRYMEFIKT